MAKKKKREGEREVDTVALETLQVEYVPADSVKPNSYNPNRQSEHEFELLCRSMRADGFTQPILVKRDTREIVDGEHRWRAAQALGLEEVPVVFTDMSIEQMKVATLRHNRARGSEDVELSGAVIRDLQKLGVLDWAAGELLLDEAEVGRLMEDLVDEEGERQLVDNMERTEEEVSQSAAAIEAERERERQRKEEQARQDEERRKQEAETFRLTLVFFEEEAEVVRGALGDQPAKRLLELVDAAS